MSINLSKSTMKVGVRAYRHFRERGDGSNGALPRGVPKKLVIKNATPVDPQGLAAKQYCKSMVQRLMDAVDFIFLQEDGADLNISLEELYRGVENLCRCGIAEQLWKDLFAKLQNLVSVLKSRFDHIKSQFIGTIAEQSGPLLDSQFPMAVTKAKYIVKQWNEWLSRLQLVRNIFFYLDRTYLLRLENKQIFDVGVELASSVFSDDNMQLHSFVLRVLEAIIAKLLFSSWKNPSQQLPIETDLINLAASIANLMRTLGRGQVLFDRVRDTMESVSRKLVQDEIISNAEHGYDSTIYATQHLAACLSFVATLGFKQAKMKHAAINVNLIKMNILQIVFIDRCDSIFGSLWDFSSGSSPQYQKYAEIIKITSEVAYFMDDQQQRPTLLDKLSSKLSSSISRSIMEIVGPSSSSMLGTKSVKQLIDLQKMVWFLSSPEVLTEELDNSNLTIEPPLSRSIRDMGGVGTKNRRHDEYFANEQAFQAAFYENFSSNLREKFKTDLQQSPSEHIIAEKLAKYAEEFMKNSRRASGSVSLLDESAGALPTDDIISLLQCLASRDIFEAFYKKDFARRLLQGKVVSAESENVFILELKQAFGPSYTQKLESMLKDLEISRKYQQDFKSYEESVGSTFRSSLSVNVLTQGKWPSYPDVRVNLPVPLQGQLTSFENFYNTRHENRVIKWQHGLGHCIIKARFPIGLKELSMPLLQGVVLMRFQEPDDDWITYEQLIKDTGMGDADLKRCLQSFTLGKAQILVKEPPGKFISPSDRFKVNDQLSEKAVRIKISNINVRTASSVGGSFSRSFSGAVPDEVQTLREVTRDRSLEIQAAIMRIMKARKQLTHTELVQQTIEHTQGRGVVNVSDIKTQIEGLLNRSFIEREQGSISTYIYV